MIQDFIEKTTQCLHESSEVPLEARNALCSRLLFRAAYLNTVAMADSRTSPELKSLWLRLLVKVPDLKSSAKLGKPVPSSFSVKIQRKLASTVPPRPIVQVSQDAAFDHLEKLCLDASVAVEVLEYHDSHSLMVCNLPQIITLLIRMIDLCDSISSSEAAAFCLCSDVVAALHLW